MAGLSSTALFRAFSGGDNADFRITCGQRGFNVHKLIICADSHYFQSVCKGNFEEQDSVNLKEEEPDIIEKVLHFLYFGYYHDDNQICDAGIHRIVHPLTTLYNSESTEPQFENLVEWPLSSQDNAMVAKMHTTIKIHQSADMLGIEPLKLVTAQKIIDMILTARKARFLEIVLETLFSTVPDDSLLRIAVIDACVHNYNKVMSLPKAVTLLEKNEARIWRLARQNCKTQLEKIEHYVRGTIVSVSKQRRCEDPFDTGCDSNDITACEFLAAVHEGVIISATASCYECDTVVSVKFDVQQSGIFLTLRSLIDILYRTGNSAWIQCFHGIAEVGQQH